MALQISEELITGHDELDKQHKELFKRVNALFDACTNQRGKSEVEVTIKYLDEYILKHFQTEEDLMIKSSFPDFLGHRAAHNQFKAIYKEIKEKITKNGISSQYVLETNKMLSNWFLTHINQEDCKLAKFLKTK